LSYLKAVITLASERVEFGEDLRTWMKAFVN
jgi:UTP--glucose-1-phosphate uridylyltransferase